MHDDRCGLSFACEPSSRRATGCQERREHFHGNRPVQFRLMALQHDAHSARADHALNVDFTKPPNRVFTFGRLQKINGKVFRRIGPGIVACIRVTVGR